MGQDFLGIHYSDWTIELSRKTIAGIHVRAWKCNKYFNSSRNWPIEDQDTLWRSFIIGWTLCGWTTFPVTPSRVQPDLRSWAWILLTEPTSTISSSWVSVRTRHQFNLSVWLISEIGSVNTSAMQYYVFYFSSLNSAHEANFIRQ